MTPVAPVSPAAPAARILIIRPSALGDVCRTVPVLVSLRRAYPDAVIDWLVQDTFLAAIEAHPDLNHPLPFPRKALGRWWRSPAGLGELIRWIRNLTDQNYDLVMDCQGLGRSGLIAWATRSPRRVGFRSAREFAWLGYSVRHPGPRAVHTVDQMLELLAAEGIESVLDLRLYLTETDRQWFEQCPEVHSTGTVKRFAVFAPASRWPSKQWPIDRWTKLIQPLRDRGFERILLIGSPNEREHIESVRWDSSSSGIVRNLVGSTTIGQTMALIAHADLVIANDSAPLHMAVGFNRACVGLFGPTEPAFVGPYQLDWTVVRKYQPPNGRSVNFRKFRLGDSLMRLIRVEDVVLKVDEVLNSWREEKEVSNPVKKKAAAPRRKIVK